MTDKGLGEYFDSAFVTWMLPGQQVTVSGTGGMVPPFGPWAVTVPQPITLTAPAFTDGGATPISTSSDLTVAWTGGQSGTMVTFGVLGPNPFTVLQCTWDATAGLASIFTRRDPLTLAHEVAPSSARAGSDASRRSATPGRRPPRAKWEALVGLVPVLGDRLITPGSGPRSARRRCVWAWKQEEFG